ncbi:hypothetical protein GH714_003578 [Hevea brasiliensis]|uniref:Lipoxygenase domain-containing protein n=1 Tax=Hevea brasiliensis TaxID=3981 RepID=A0A6A6KZX3_HEVBR|nr:hypothetical protein GH714_003578 [Hevea brasiliensis]
MGVAVEDPTAKHGRKLAIEDHPFANDGLMLWDAIKQWVTDYVNHNYPEASKVKSNSELQAWPTIARNNMPTEDPAEEDFKLFLKKPEQVLLKCFPSKQQATKVMAILDVQSSHSPDEENIGDALEPSWKADPVIRTAYERFNARLKELEATIDERNNHLKNTNRAGAGVVPYELKPFSESWVTGKGVPNSISI